MSKATVPQQQVPLTDGTYLISLGWYRALVDLFRQRLMVDGSVTMTGPLTLPSYTVANLPTVGAAQIAYATNGRKNGEGGGAGTGVLVFSDASAWRACDTGATVAA